MVNDLSVNIKMKRRTLHYGHGPLLKGQCHAICFARKTDRNLHSTWTVYTALQCKVWKVVVSDFSAHIWWWNDFSNLPFKNRATGNSEVIFRAAPFSPEVRYTLIWHISAPVVFGQGKAKVNYYLCQCLISLSVCFYWTLLEDTWICLILLTSPEYSDGNTVWFVASPYLDGNHQQIRRSLFRM
jgi:hypothetical protein